MQKSASPDKTYKYESKSFNKKKKCRLQDCSQKRQAVRNQQKEPSLQTKARIIS